MDLEGFNRHSSEFFEELETRTRALQEDIKTLHPISDKKEIKSETQTYSPYHQVLLYLGKKDFKIMVTEKAVNTQGSLELKIQYNPQTLYKSFATILKVKHGKDLHLKETCEFEDGFLLLDLSFESLTNVKNAFSKHNKNFIQIRQFPSLNKNGLRINIREGIHDRITSFYNKNSVDFKTKVSQKKRIPRVRSMIPERVGRAFKHTRAIGSTAALAVIIFMFISSIIYHNQSVPFLVEKGDRVRIHYTVWEHTSEGVYDDTTELLFLI